MKLNFNALVQEAKLPAILHWRQNHFVVHYKAKNKKLYVADPARGLITYTSEEFKEQWVSDKGNGQDEGIALLLEPSPLFYNNDFDESEQQPSKLGFKNIFNYILHYKKLVFQLFVGLGVASLLQLFLPFLTQSIVDVGINTGNIHFVYIALLAQIALHISAALLFSILTEFAVQQLFSTRL